jgi:hypothetical protein
VIDTSQLRPAQLRSWVRSLVGVRESAADPGLRVLRLQARRAAGRRLRVRRARAAQPLLHPRTAPADRPRRPVAAYLEAQPEVGEMLARSSLPAPLAAGVRGRPAQLPHGGHRLHRRAAPLGLHRSRLARRFEGRTPRCCATASSTRATEVRGLREDRPMSAAGALPASDAGPCPPAAAVPAAVGAVPRRPAGPQGLRGALPRPGGPLPAQQQPSAWSACARAPRPGASPGRCASRRGRAGPCGRGRRRTGRHPARALPAAQRFRLGTPTQRADGLWTAPGRAHRARPAADARSRPCCRRCRPWPRRSALQERRRPALCRPSGWTTPAGWPTAGASCCRCRWRPSRS